MNFNSAVHNRFRGTKKNCHKTARGRQLQPWEGLAHSHIIITFLLVLPMCQTEPDILQSS